MGGAAQRLEPLLHALLGPQLPVRLRAWDGSEVGPSEAEVTIVVRSRRALRRLLWRPDELGLGRAYVAGELDVEGDIYTALSMPDRLSERPDLRLPWRDRLAAVATAVRLGAIGPSPPAPPEEVRLSGRRHSRERDARAISHHYDVGNDFYRLVLGPTMVYSCAYWADPSYALDEAQIAKCDLVVRKLGLAKGARLLDVGCGWGTLVIHAAREYGVRAVGVTVSEQQATLGRERVRESGLQDLVEIRHQDYRDVSDGPYDGIASIGMAEHVGAEQAAVYAGGLYRLLVPEGRLLHHAISRRPGPHQINDEGVLRRYVFPDGELLPLADTVAALEGVGFEVRDVEALREHYPRTLRAWEANLSANWDEVVGLTSPGRARVWRLYMANSALAFEQNRIGVNQVLAVRVGARGSSGMPRTRTDWLLQSPRGG